DRMSRSVKRAAGLVGLCSVLLAGGGAAPAAEHRSSAAVRAYMQDRFETHKGFYCGSFFVCRKHSHASKTAHTGAGQDGEARARTLGFYSEGARLLASR